MVYNECCSEVPSITAILEAVAAQDGVDPMELEPPLFDVVDPDALEAILSTGATAQSEVTVTFEWAGYDIVVGSDETLVASSKEPV
ncbi:HalOD1 output domain-containing protein [Natronomonas sp.]|uniref:HalOD1 output domain-containing protein n=1 Tax=Natronomonas sp. TaxID=2184060 RepID=UPI003976449C